MKPDSMMRLYARMFFVGCLAVIAVAANNTDACTAFTEKLTQTEADSLVSFVRHMRG